MLKPAYRRSLFSTDYLETVSNQVDGRHKVTNNQIQSIIERIERLEEDKAAISSDHQDAYAEAGMATADDVNVPRDYQDPQAGCRRARQS